MPRQLALGLVALLAAALLVTAEASASSKQVMTFEAPSELLDDGRRDATLDEIAAFGVRRIRALVYWRDFAPAPRSKARPRFRASSHADYPAGTWDRLDRLVDGARKRDIEVQLTLTGPVPRWATKRRRDQLTEPDAREFGRWVTAVAARYGDRVDLWSVWNEPNQPQFLLPQYERGKLVSPPLYRGLYRAAERALHGAPGGRRDVVLMGETSPVGNPRVGKPLAFMRGVLCLDSRWRKAQRCGKLRTDGYAHHAYTRKSGPRFRPVDPDEVTIGALDRLVRALDRAAKAGAIDRGRGIFLTEFGIQSTPDTVAGVSLAKQAEYLAIAERIAYANSRVRSFSQYLMRDDLANADAASESDRYPGFETGLRRYDGREKPSYRGFMLPLAAARYGANDVLWGRVRPARAATEVTIERRAGKGWKRLERVTTSAAGVYGLRAGHRKGQAYRVRWVAPDGRAHVGPAIRAY